MKFKTASGTEYILTDIEMTVMATGEPCPSVGPQGIPVVMVYTGKLERIGKPLRDISTGGFVAEVKEDVVEFYKMPEIGEKFVYTHPVWAGCYSTSVTEIEKSE